MKILFLTTHSPYPATGGQTQRIFNLLKQLSRFAKVTLMAYVQYDIEWQHKSDLEEYCEEVYQYKIPANSSFLHTLSLAFINLFSPWPYFCQKYYTRDFQNQFNALWNRNQYDLIFLDNLSVLRYIDFNVIKKDKILLGHHNVESLLMKRNAAQKSLLSGWYYILQSVKLAKLEARYAPKCAINIVCSDIDKCYFEQRIQNAKFYVIPNGVDTKYYCSQSPMRESNSIVWVGGMTYFPNKIAVNYFCKEIFERIVTQLPDVCVRFIGRSPTEALIKLGNKYPENIEILGFVDDIRPIVDKSMVFIVPIKTGSGTRLKILDALAMGKAIVSDSIGCEGIDVINGKNILVADTPAEFAEKIMLLLNNDEYRLKVENAARQLADKYDWDMIGDDLKSILTNEDSFL